MQGGKIRAIFNLSSNYLLMQLYLNTILKILCLHVKKQRFAIYTQLSCGPTTEFQSGYGLDLHLDSFLFQHFCWI